MEDWKYNVWMGWWEQGDGKLFYGVHVDYSRIKDEKNFHFKSAMRVLVVDNYNLHSSLSPMQWRTQKYSSRTKIDGKCLLLECKIKLALFTLRFSVLCTYCHVPFHRAAVDALCLLFIVDYVC